MSRKKKLYKMLVKNFSLGLNLINSLIIVISLISFVKTKDKSHKYYKSAQALISLALKKYL